MHFGIACNVTFYVFYHGKHCSSRKGGILLLHFTLWFYVNGQSQVLSYIQIPAEYTEPFSCHPRQTISTKHQERIQLAARLQKSNWTKYIFHKKVQFQEKCTFCKNFKPILRSLPISSICIFSPFPHMSLK